jgi:hypothetical protein
MGNTYSSEAFFGTFAPARSPVGKRLSAFIEEGTPGETPHPDVVVDRVGNAPMGEEWIVLRLEEPSPRASRDDEIVAPVFLGPQPIAPFEAVFRWLKIAPEDMAPIGWHFAASCG